LLEIFKTFIYNIDQPKEINLQTKNEMIRTQPIELVRKREEGKYFCLSKATRQVDPNNWRDLMDATRNEKK
jgi:hypothetical protein